MFMYKLGNQRVSAMLSVQDEVVFGMYKMVYFDGFTNNTYFANSVDDLKLKYNKKVEEMRLKHSIVCPF